MKHASSLLPVKSALHHRVSILPRPCSTGSPVKKDVPQTNTDKSEEEEEKLDVDRWKSIMRSQAPFEEKQVNDKVETSGDADNQEEEGDDFKEASSLDAMRDLVVMWRQAGRLVPQQIKDEQLQELSKLTTKSSRKKYLKFLAIKEGHKLALKEKQQRKRAEREAATLKKTDDEEEGDEQRQLKNTFFLQFWSRTLDKLLAWRSAQAMTFGQPLVFDMSYDSSMARREMENTVSQLMEVEGWNRRATEPFHLHFCNLQPDGPYMKELLKRYGAETWDRLLITSTHHQHVDLFPQQQLVYLTADSPNVLRTFDHSKVYIIGALVDRSVRSGLSLANAKRLKLATARLPLDEFLDWEMGGKNLTLDQMIRIMLAIKDTGKWEEALKFVPKRKHDGFYQQVTNTNNNKAAGVTHHRSTEGSNTLLKFGERNSERTFKNQSVYKPLTESGFNGRLSNRNNTQASTKVRTSLKNTVEARKHAGKHKLWYQDE